MASVTLPVLTTCAQEPIPQPTAAELAEASRVGSKASKSAAPELWAEAMRSFMFLSTAQSLHCSA